MKVTVTVQRGWLPAGDTVADDGECGLNLAPEVASYDDRGDGSVNGCEGGDERRGGGEGAGRKGREG